MNSVKFTFTITINGNPTTIELNDTFSTTELKDMNRPQLQFQACIEKMASYLNHRAYKKQQATRNIDEMVKNDLELTTLKASG